MASDGGKGVKAPKKVDEVRPDPIKPNRILMTMTFREDGSLAFEIPAWAVLASAKELLHFASLVRAHL